MNKGALASGIGAVLRSCSSPRSPSRTEVGTWPSISCRSPRSRRNARSQQKEGAPVLPQMSSAVNDSFKPFGPAI